MAQSISSDEASFLLAREEAEAGNRYAQYATGNCYMLGKGTKTDTAKALHWYREAADKGHAGAQRCLGNIYAMILEDYNEAVRWYDKAARAGNMKARFNLGLMHQIGYGVDKSYEQAFYWHRLSAEQGYSIAQFNVGLLYADGKGVAADQEQAFAWLKRAAEQNHAVAQYNVALAYEAGIGVAPDFAQATRWYARAAQGGDYFAQARYASILAEAGGLCDTRRAYIWFMIASCKQALEDEALDCFLQVKQAIDNEEFKSLNAFAFEMDRLIKPRQSRPRILVSREAALNPSQENAA